MATKSVNFKRVSGTQLTLNFINSAYTGTIPTFTISSDVVFRYDSEGDDAFAAIRKTSVEVSVVLENSDVLDDFFNENLKLEVVTTTDMVFSGYYNGDGIEFEDTDYLKKLKLTFVDGFNVLKSINFEPKVGITPKHLTYIGQQRFRYKIGKEIFGEILSKTGLSNIVVAGQVSKFDYSGNAISTTEGSFTKGTMAFETAELDIGVYGKTLMDVIESICTAFGYYACIQGDTMYFVNIHQLINLNSLEYTKWNLSGGVGVINYYGTISPNKLAITNFITNLVKTSGKQNVIVKAESGINFELAKGWELFKDIGAELFNYGNQQCIQKGSLGSISFSARDNVMAFKDTGASNWSEGYWRKHYVKIPISIKYQSGIFVDVKITISELRFKQYNRYFGLVVCYGDYSETGENSYLEKNVGGYDFVIDSNDVFVYNKYTINANETEVAINIRVVWTAAPYNDIELLIGQCYYVNGSYNILATTYINDVKCEVSYEDLSFYKGENLTINNAGAKKNINLDMPYSFTMQNSNISEGYSIYKNAIYYTSGGNNVLGAKFNDARNTTKYVLQEYTGRLIAREYSRIRRDADIEAIADLSVPSEPTGMFNIFNRIFKVRNRYYMPLNGEYDINTDRVKMSCVEVVQDTYETNYLLTESGNNIITETGLKVAKE